MTVLGINEAHNSSCAIATDGKIIACAQEERFTRLKNQCGIPLNAIAYCLEYSNINPKDVDLVVFTGGIPQFITSSATYNNAEFKKSYVYKLLNIGKYAYIYFMVGMMSTEYRFKFLRGIHDTTLMAYYKLTQKIFFPKTAKLLEKRFGIDAKKHIYFDHHNAHAVSALYSSGMAEKFNEILVLTCDGGGDGLSATISTYKNGRLKRIAASTQDNSLGCLYGAVTWELGMKYLEHEYKVMGLAPYAEEYGTEKIYEFLKTMITLDKNTLRFKTIVSSDNLGRYLREKAPRYRFDHLAGAIQKLTEELLCGWIEAAMNRTGIHNLVFSGGVAQNVKANQRIAGLPGINSFYIMPSSGDESNAIGAAYWGSKLIKPKVKLEPLSNLYLGPEYSAKEIEGAIKNAVLGSKYKVSRMKDPEFKVAKLLAEGKIVARFAGRMEFGARALGNRSILADPSTDDVVKKINREIKSRDFWMPFAPTILEEDASKYITHNKNTEASYMMITFDTKPARRKDITAAIHPFDYTTRPQILTEQANPDYYKLIRYFKQLTGRGAILNTSFNLHGEPNVCSPNDALLTLQRSGLKYLALENFLIEKHG